MRRRKILIVIIGILTIIAIFAGCIESSSGITETTVTKLYSAKNVQWMTVIENTGYSTSQSLAPSNRFIQTSDGGFFIAGFFFNNSGGFGLRTLKIDSAGNLSWEKRFPGLTGEILTLLQRDDGGYLVFTREGRLFMFDSSGLMEGTQDISDKINQTPGGGRPQITLLSALCTPSNTLTVTGNNNANVYRPVLIATFSRNGTLLGERNYPGGTIDASTPLLPIQDGGLLLGKSFSTDKPGGGKQILIEKTDANGLVVWDSPLGICNFSFCNNDLLGMDESANREYDVIYQSHEQSNRSPGNMPVKFVHAELDRNGRVIKQDMVTDISELPLWIFNQDDSSSELINLIDERTMNAVIAEKRRGNPVNRFDTFLKTGDGGYALLGTRYYF